MGTKVLAICLDSAEPHILLEMIQTGQMPYLNNLMARGSYGYLSTPDGQADDSVYSSFATACMPGRHGVYDPFQTRAGSYRQVTKIPADPSAPYFWDLLSEQGKRVAVIDCPKVPLSKSVNGIHVVDWYVHGQNEGLRSTPAAITEDLVDRYGLDPIDRPWDPAHCCHLRDLSAKQADWHAEVALKTLKNKSDFSIQTLRGQEWDLFLTCFKESHCILHRHWWALDPTHPEHDPETAKPVKKRAQHLFFALDQAIQANVEAAGPNAQVIVFSNLGMDQNVGANHLLDQILLRLDHGMVASLWRPIYSRIKRANPSKFKNFNVFLRKYRRAFALHHNEMSGAVRFNLVGREKHGIVKPGIEKHRLAMELKEHLERLVHPGTQTAIVSKVLITEDVFPGKACANLPDLFVCWNRTAPIHAVSYPGKWTLEAQFPYHRSGNHIEGGMYLASGGKVKQSDQPIHGRLIDLPPTFASLLDTRLSGVDGAPLEITACK